MYLIIILELLLRNKRKTFIIRINMSIKKYVRRYEGILDFNQVEYTLISDNLFIRYRSRLTMISLSLTYVGT